MTTGTIRYMLCVPGPFFGRVLSAKLTTLYATVHFPFVFSLMSCIKLALIRRAWHWHHQVRDGKGWEERVGMG